ncbi:MAG: glycoside hydrolase family 2 TIM barrel-domain containing protein [Lachnospiraceae bacterium]|nr:glycoside hydrolase family 2 TIM barrel-domain containing protein [Lachnospiraceae bacterium]
MKIAWNREWEFTPTFSAEFLAGKAEAAEVQTVELPHSGVETPFHYFDEGIYQMVAGYRKTLFAPEDWQDKTVLLTVGGAAHDSELYVNGKSVYRHHCGYTAFTCDIQPFLKLGEENLIVLRVDSREELPIPPFGFVIDYMTYCGLYREVNLDIRPQTYIKDIFVHGIPTAEGGCLEAEVTLKSFETAVAGSLHLQLTELGSGRVIELGEMPVTESVFRQRYTLTGVTAWSIKQPQRYRLTVVYMPAEGSEKTLVDRDSVIFGFRSAVFQKDGFYLNGQKLRLRGLNRHQSYPYVGYAMPASMQAYDADILKYELGLNAVRTSHYPQSQHFIDRCDEIGLLVVTEIPGWQHIGDEAWQEQAVINTRDMVLQYRNHPSIILWGTRINESADHDDFYARTNAMAKSLDSSRATGGVRAHAGSSLLEDVYTFNDFIHDGRAPGCRTKAEVTSDMGKAYLVTEYNGHMYPTKTFVDERQRTEHALRHARVLEAIAAEEEIAGSFGWCMFDYNTHRDFGSGDRICYHGVMDMFRNAKPAAAIYAAQQEERPVLELSASMDIGECPGCYRGEIYLYSNAPEIQMYKKDRFIKSYTQADSPFTHLTHGPIIVDDMIGETMREAEGMDEEQAEKVKKILNGVASYGFNQLPEEIKALIEPVEQQYGIGAVRRQELYNRYVGDWGNEALCYTFKAVRDGQVVAEMTKEAIMSLALKSDVSHTELREGDTYDVAAVRIRTVDQNGNRVYYYQEPVFFETEGVIELIGPAVTSLKGGMIGTYVRTVGQVGEGLLRIRTAQTEAVEIRFSVCL